MYLNVLYKKILEILDILSIGSITSFEYFNTLFDKLEIIRTTGLWCSLRPLGILLLIY